MKQKDYIVIESLKDGESVKLYGDPAGLKRLAHELLKLVDGTNDDCFNHEHFFSPDFGGDFLSDEIFDKDAKTVKHIKIYCFKGAKCQS